MIQSKPQIEHAAAGDELDALRAVLLGTNHRALLELAQCLDNPQQYGAHLASAVAEAIEQRNCRDDAVADAISPAVESGLRVMVERNPAPLVDALYPVMGPAIRRSIHRAMQEALENFNRAVETSLSLRAIRWRFDALRSGRSYAEIAMLNSLDCCVEQVFLVHRETSMLLQHIVVQSAEAMDADMVSSMLSAIQDFVADSFRVGQGDELETLSLGDLTLCVESGPLAILAVAVRGNMPQSLRVRLARTLESIHCSHRDALQNFDGDARNFADTAAALEQCRQVDDSADGLTPPGTSKPLLVLLVAAMLISWWSWHRYQQSADWRALLQNLRGEPGYVVTDYGVDGEGYFLSGLRDPLARPLSSLIAQSGSTRLQLRTNLHAFHAHDPALVLERFSATVPLPAGMHYELQGATLLLSGTASAAWMRVQLPRIRSIAGIEAVDVNAVRTVQGGADG